MDPSAKVLAPETRTVNKYWTIVLPRRGRKGRNLSRIRTPEEQQKPLFPTELLSLAILMKRKLSWIGDVEVFDPILSATECQVLESFGFSVLSVKEQGCRCATKPTLFNMPHSVDFKSINNSSTVSNFHHLPLLESIVLCNGISFQHPQPLK
ncbi:hypothetical protein QYF36_013883 [Acer negundo]|nr:hypothetical protein QYF36_013883 [Acer negundo]